MNEDKNKIKLFAEQKVRTLWGEEAEKTQRAWGKLLWHPVTMNRLASEYNIFASQKNPDAAQRILRTF